MIISLKKEKTFPTVAFKNHGSIIKGRQPGLEIFFEEDLYINKGFTHTLPFQLKKSRTPVKPLEERYLRYWPSKKIT